MKKIKLVVALVATLSIGAQVASVSAAEGKGSFNQGDFIIGPSVGLNFGALGMIIPVGLNLEYGLSKNFGIGLYAGYAGYSMTFFTTTISVTLIPVMGTFMYHFDLGNPNIDLGVGVEAGYAIGMVSGGGLAIPVGGLAYGGFVNARFYLSQVIALKARAGYSNVAPMVELGVDFRL